MERMKASLSKKKGKGVCVQNEDLYEQNQFKNPWRSVGQQPLHT